MYISCCPLVDMFKLTLFCVGWDLFYGRTELALMEGIVSPLSFLKSYSISNGYLASLGAKHSHAMSRCHTSVAYEVQRCGIIVLILSSNLLCFHDFYSSSYRDLYFWFCRGVCPFLFHDFCFGHAATLSHAVGCDSDFLPSSHGLCSYPFSGYESDFFFEASHHHVSVDCLGPCVDQDLGSCPAFEKGSWLWRSYVDDFHHLAHIDRY